MSLSKSFMKRSIEVELLVDVSHVGKDKASWQS